MRVVSVKTVHYLYITNTQYPKSSSRFSSKATGTDTGAQILHTFKVAEGCSEWLASCITAFCFMINFSL